MKVSTKKALMNLLIASSLLFLIGGNALAAPGDIPDIGDISGPSNTDDVTSGLGIFSGVGKFLMDYAIHIAVFFMVLATVCLSARGSWARSNQKSDDASDARTNTKGLILDGLMTMAALMFVFFIMAPFIKSFVPT